MYVLTVKMLEVYRRQQMFGSDSFMTVISIYLTGKILEMNTITK